MFSGVLGVFLGRNNYKNIVLSYLWRLVSRFLTTFALEWARSWQSDMGAVVMGICYGPPD